MLFDKKCFTCIFSEWLFSEVMCKAIPYLQAVVVGASVNTLAAVAVERCVACDTVINLCYQSDSELGLVLKDVPLMYPVANVYINDDSSQFFWLLIKKHSN